MASTRSSSSSSTGQLARYTTSNLNFRIIRHLVRTQNPTTTVSAIETICSTVKKLPSPGELIKSSYDFLVVQLANQGHLSEAVLAEQLVSRIKDESLQSRQHWSDMLDNLISRWRVDHKPSLNTWLAKESDVSSDLHRETEHFTSYFRSLFDQNDHPKFVKAAQLANEIHQILPLRNSLEIF
ncbi:hypothetical protein H4Q26_006279 [Puccinia striiformis f. sp. tritici PST-130]|nr:hypothetical protein H4Q26_006279 [Puccinia striiformis f. sp. tritici PST-130]